MFRFVSILFLALLPFAGLTQNKDVMTNKAANALIGETSPYLLQHAYNPVQWEPWKSDLLRKAQKENKLLLISIGYAACHWCHVMEKECFEDEEVAEIMNANFINIKVDREERPDIDHIYMDALQIMTGGGGWPLNVVALPDGRPFWGTTYMNKERWMSALEQLQELYKRDPDKVEGYAEKLADGIKAINLIEAGDEEAILSMPQLKDLLKGWTRYFDKRYGGYQRAPKFMMPAHLNFLLHFGTATQDKEVLEHVYLSLDKMAYGGLFDHLEGGFSRYSVDTKWHVPHFEKMLYDNAQLISVYAKAFANTQNEHYKQVVEETISFVSTNLMDSNFGFYSSLDADSQNENKVLEEGAYYVWKKEDLQALLGTDFELFKDYYNINSYGHWEHGNHVLIRDLSEEKLAEKHGVSLEVLKTRIENCKTLLVKEKKKRSKPRLDDKILTSWNGLMLSGLIDAYRFLGNERYLELSLQNATFIEQNLIAEDGKIFHNYKDGKRTISGYLEDYAAVAAAFLDLYQVTLDQKWLNTSKSILDYCIGEFYDSMSTLFFFTSNEDSYVIRKTIETLDNVIPASNSIMAKNLFQIAKLFPEEKYSDIAKSMVQTIQQNFQENIQGYSNWLHLVLFYHQPFYEVAVVGEEFKQKVGILQRNYIPNAIFCGVKDEGSLSLLENRFVSGKTLIYVCQHGACKFPVEDAKTVINQLSYTPQD